MKVSEIRGLTSQELNRRIDDTRQELMNLRFQLSMGSLKDFTRLSQTRQVIARLLTIKAERESVQEEGEA